ncbi:hypothetical protein [Micromonospora zhanjiangensis]|uniref:Uncharacterized protein n=1 Tax=Micromonospora zhanjiangensis TaxID=1522057 RepID=A0ABV8KKA8_9ACTN
MRRDPDPALAPNATSSRNVGPERYVELVEIEREMARLDAVYRPVATAPVGITDPDAFLDLGTAVEADLTRLGVADQAEAVLRAVVEAYAAGDEPVRTAVRRLFDRYPSFRWAAHLPRDWTTAGEFRARLICLSARDQGADTRDEILALRDLCHRARCAGIDVDPILDEVAAMSSDRDRYGMGSMRHVILTYGRGRTG